MGGGAGRVKDVDAVLASEGELAREIRRRRKEARMSQSELANLTGYTRQHISRAEQPAAGLASGGLVQVIDAALSLDGDLVTLHARLHRQRLSRRKATAGSRAQGRPAPADGRAPATTGESSVTGAGTTTDEKGDTEAPPGTEVAAAGAADVASVAEGEAMKRRKFLGHAAAITVGAVSFDVERWHAATTLHDRLPTRLDGADVDQLEQITALLRSMDYQHGGGGCRDLALTQLERARRLLGLPSTESVQRRLWSAVADLHNLVGWTSFDIGIPDAAREHFRHALELAQGAGEPSLVANVLYRAGRLHLHTGWAEDALRLFQLGQIAARDSGSELSLALLSANEAWAYGQLGDPVRAVQSLRRARDDFARVDAASEPGWVQFFGLADLDALDGVTHVELAHHDPGQAEIGIERLLASIAVRGDAMARSRAFETTSLATAYFLSGQVEDGTAAGRRAVEMAEHVRSRRVIDRLSPLARAASRYGHGDADELAAEVRLLQTT